MKRNKLNLYEVKVNAFVGFEDRHFVCVDAGTVNRCVDCDLRRLGYCAIMACFDCEREDSTVVYFKEVR